MGWSGHGGALPKPVAPPTPTMPKFRPTMPARPTGPLPPPANSPFPPKGGVGGMGRMWGKMYLRTGLGMLLMFVPYLFGTKVTIDSGYPVGPGYYTGPTRWVARHPFSYEANGRLWSYWPANIPPPSISFTGLPPWHVGMHDSPPPGYHLALYQQAEVVNPDGDWWNYIKSGVVIPGTAPALHPGYNPFDKTMLPADLPLPQVQPLPEVHPVPLPTPPKRPITSPGKRPNVPGRPVPFIPGSPEPITIPVPYPQPDPIPVSVNTPGTSPSAPPSFGGDVGPNGRVRPVGGRGSKGRPPRRVKEKKLRFPGAYYQLLWGVHYLTETADFLDVLLDAFGVPKGSIRWRMEWFFEHGGEFDLDKFITGLIKEKLGDIFWGRIGQLVGSKIPELGIHQGTFPYGAGTAF